MSVNFPPRAQNNERDGIMTIRLKAIRGLGEEHLSGVAMLVLLLIATVEPGSTGAYLASCRSLARWLGRSANAVSAAFRELERRGLITGVKGPPRYAGVVRLTDEGRRLLRIKVA